MKGKDVEDKMRDVDTEGMVREFHEKMGVMVHDTPQHQLPMKKLRFALIDEEVSELDSAIADNNIVAAADALADIVYVCYGAALTWGIDLDAVIAEVHASNMTKTPGLMNEHGKILKGPDYRPPDIARLLS